MTPARPRRLCPDWKEREAFISGPAELLDALDEHWDEHGDCDRLHMERFQPKLGGGRGGRGRHDQVPQERLRGASPTARSRSSWPARRPGSSCPTAAARASATPASATLKSGRDPRPAHRQGHRQRAARRSAPASTPPRAQSRSSCERTTRSATDDREPAPQLTPEQIEAIGKRVRRAPRGGQGRPRRPRRALHPLDDRAAPPARAARPRAAASARATSRRGSAGTATLSLAKILENMEIGHNVLHGQWDWMNDPVINSAAWDWDTRVDAPRRGSTRTTTSTTRTRTSAARTRTSATRSCGSTRTRSGTRSTCCSRSTTCC